VWSLLELIRTKPEILKEDLARRGMDPKIVDEVVKLDARWREVKFRLDELRRYRNELTTKIARSGRSEKEGLLKEAKRVAQEVKSLEAEYSRLTKQRQEALWGLPAAPIHPEVPACPEGEEGVPIRFWGRPKVWKGHVEQFLQQTERWGFKVDYEVTDWKPLGHADEAEKVLELADTKRAAKVSGARFYYLYDDLVWLDIALILFAVDRLTTKGFRLVTPPYMLRGEFYRGVTPLEDFIDAIYKVEEEDLFLISTSEHPLVAQHAGEEIQDVSLPLMYVGISPCFRKEAGAHGRDTKGIFRVHQFHKVEQVVFCMPEESWEWHERLISNAEELWRELGIPYRIVDICAAELGPQAARKFDLEAWMPGQGKYREVVSCSNCLDWQSFRLRIRYIRGDGSRGYVHTLNSTGIATSRAITAILENFQRPNGSVEIPKVLRPYLELFEKAPKDEIVPAKRTPSA